jgi:hypothetical protein
MTFLIVMFPGRSFAKNVPCVVHLVRLRAGDPGGIKDEIALGAFNRIALVLYMCTNCILRPLGL